VERGERSVLTVPHSHAYNPVFDAAEEELAGSWEWTDVPTQPDDEY
jgi:hypothetical protein